MPGHRTETSKSKIGLWYGCMSARPEVNFGFFRTGISQASGGRLPAGDVSGTGCGVYRYDSGGIILAEYLQGIVVAARGVPVTLIISLVAVLGGLVIGLLVAIAKRSGNKLLRGIATVYVDVLRGTPLLVQVLILAYGVPQLLKSSFGLQFNWAHMIIVGFIACGINSSAYMAEIIRSGLQAIDIGQSEAARSLGMSQGHTSGIQDNRACHG